MSKAVIGFLIMIIIGVIAAIAGGILLGQHSCLAGCRLVVGGSGVFLIGLIYWIAGATSQVEYVSHDEGGRGPWLRVRFGNEPWWAQLVMVVLIVIMAVLIIFVCPLICARW